MFTQEADITKDRIAAFELRLYARDPLAPDDQNAGYIVFQIGMSDGSIQNRQRNDFIERLQDDPVGQQHLQNLIALRDYIRVRLEDEVLPV